MSARRITALVPQLFFVHAHCLPAPQIVHELALCSSSNPGSRVIRNSSGIPVGQCSWNSGPAAYVLPTDEGALKTANCSC